MASDMDGFVHLHVHSHYSLLDGGNRLEDLVSSAQQMGMGAIALTDHGNLFGAMEFYELAREQGIQPILGMEAYIAPASRLDKASPNISAAACHLLLLATSPVGWRNLMRLSSRAYLEGFYYRPRVDRELLNQFGQDLICTSACLSGEIPQALAAGRHDRARQIAGEYRDIFGPERFFIEIQKQGLPDQDQVNPQLVALARELGVGIVGTNDVHFLRRQDKPAHEVLTCISTGKTLASGGALSYPPELYLKSPQEMRQALRDWPEAADNTLRIAQMCRFTLDASGKYLPAFPTPDGQSQDRYLAHLAWEGLRKRFKGADIPAAYAQRLEWELKVIADKGYSSYFLVVNDFVQFARRNDIPAATRGSGVATLLGYALGMAEVDPLRYGLLFERFADPQRQEAPDIDVDMCPIGRSRIIQYVREKYGHVAQIVTYGTLKARAVLRDVGRVMDLPLAQVDSICKKVPEALGMTLRGALDSEPDLRNLYEADAKVRELFDSAMKLEGLARHTGVHAAGVIIAQQPLEDIVPLYRQADREDPITQWDGPTCDKAGLMKVDFLGLQTLTIVHRAGQLVGRRHGRVIDPAKLPLDDQEVYELFRAGRTDGVFQFESDGMKAVLMQMRPTRIEDLIAANAMYRPGPMELIPTYCARKHGQEPAPSVHPLVDDMLAETYGIMCYQEQVMQVLNRLGQLPLNRALSLIRAVSKKKQDVIAAERQNFVQGALANGIEQADANRLFELIQRFAGYGFNKAHSTSYAILAYQTAYFKVHYPQEFIAATLTLESGDIDKVVQYIAEAARMGIKVARPDVNTCSSEFTVDDQGVRFGLAAVKGVGEKAVEAMLAARQQAGRFRDLFHFCQHVDLRAVNRATIEALVKCGAFDSLGASRAAMVAALDQAIELGQAAAADRRSGQMSFFAALGQADQDAPPRFPDVEPWSEAQLLAAEKETLGFYITSHPLTPYARELAALGSPAGVQLARLEDYPAQARVVVGCMVAQVRPMLAKSGRSAGAKMAMLTLEDLSGKADAVLFANNYASYAPLLEPERIVFVAGTVDRRRERPCILVDHVIPADQALEQLTGLVMLRLPPLAVESAVLPRLHDVLVRHRGDCPILLELRAESRHDVRVTLRPNACWSVKPCRGLVEELTGLLGQENVVLRPARREPNGRNGSRRPPAPGQGALIPSALPRAGEGEDAAPATAGPP